MTAIIPQLYAASLSLDPGKIYRDELLPADRIAEEVARNGIVVFPAFLKQDRLKALNQEFDSLIEEHRQGAGLFPSDVYGNMVNVRVMLERAKSDTLPNLIETFTDPFMADVAHAFFGNDQFKLNSQIFVTELTEGPVALDKPPFALHFDKRQVLKFYFYLEDTDEANGAMRASPGTHFINRERRLEAMKHDKLNDIANVLPEPDVPSLPIVGPAGTLFVFDTDVCHGASRVGPNQVRRTIRGHTHSQAMLDAMAEDSRRLDSKTH